MSLKAKVEAVVYAADEPVTMAQLAAIFANEVWEELEAEARARASGGDGEAVLAEAEQGDERPVPPETSCEPEFNEPESDEPESHGAKLEAPESDEPISESVDKAPAQAEGGLFDGVEAPEQPALDAKKADRLRNARIRDRLQLLLEELIAAYAGGERGMEIREVAGGYRMTTKPEYHDAVRSFVRGLKPPMKLSLQALETLAVVAYKQPVTAPEVSEIRGVDSGGVLGSLIGRKLIATAGRKHVIGRPILYKTTKEFLLRFGLKDVNDLPSMEEFEKMAGELAQAEAEAEDAAMRSSELPEEDQSERPRIDSEPVAPIPGDDRDEGDEPLEAAEEDVTSLGIEPAPLAGEKAELPGEASEDREDREEFEWNEARNSREPGENNESS